MQHSLFERGMSQTMTLVLAVAAIALLAGAVLFLGKSEKSMMIKDTAMGGNEAELAAVEASLEADFAAEDAAIQALEAELQ
jgi:hypothetical protein